jgi:uncharacterized protein (DUF1778 family)
MFIEKKRALAEVAACRQGPKFTLKVSGSHRTFKPYGIFRTPKKEQEMLSFQAHAQEGARTARMEQRTTPETKELIERAAYLQGVNASEFLVAHAALAARETISRFESTVVRPEDRDAFIRAFDDTEPNKDLVDLMALHGRVTSKR